MSEYKVKVTRRITESTIVTVKSDGETGAAFRAASQTMYLPDAAWTPGDYEASGEVIKDEPKKEPGEDRAYVWVVTNAGYVVGVFSNADAAQAYVADGHQSYDTERRLLR